MGFRPILIVIGFLTAGAIVAAQRPTPDVVPAANGDLAILPVTHASVSIRYRSNVILIDPARFVPGQPPAPKPTEEEIAQFKSAPSVVPPDGE
jgi:hypothetical protein